jgi:hypothetical protein
MARGIRATVLILMAGVVVAIACASMKNTIRIAPNTAADSVVFLLRSAIDSGLPPDDVYGMSVVRCDTKDVMWTIAADGSREMPAQVVYGKPVTGFPTRAGPMPLTPGCYEVILSGATSRRFEVGSGGRTRALP